MNTAATTTKKGAAWKRRRPSRGGTMVEFALSFGLLFLCLAGTWQFGYTFFLYNRLQSAVRDGARYAATAAYDSPNGSEFRGRVQNMVVYGNPDPDEASQPVVPGLDTDQVTVTEEKSGVMPTRVTVQIDDFQINAVFTEFTLSGKPRCRFNYAGQLLAN